MKTLKFALGAVFTLALSLSAGTAHADLWSFEDDDIEFILDPVTLAPVTSGSISVGQIFVSVFEIPTFTIDGVNAIPAGQELTGVAAVELLSIQGSGAGAVYTFGAYSGFNTLFPSVGEFGDEAIAMFLNGTSGAGGDINLDLNRSTNPATNCTSLADCIDQATRGDLLQVDGFGLDPDEFWVATQTNPGGGDIGTILGLGNNTPVATVFVGLSNLFNTVTPVGFQNALTNADCGNPGYIADGCVQLVGTAPLTGGSGLVNGAIAHSDFDGQKIVNPVPEPSTIALLGMGLLGFGARFSNRKA